MMIMIDSKFLKNKLNYAGLILSFTFVTLLSVELHGQPPSYQFNQLSVKDGLAQSAVYTITKDKFGYMWFGTRSGLSRYDGEKFINYFKDSADSTTLSSNHIISLKEINNGNILVGTSAGLNRFNRSDNTFSQINHSAFQNISFYDIQELERGSLLLASSKGIYFMDRATERITRKNKLNIFNRQVVKCIVRNLDNNYLVGTPEGLFAESNGQFDKILDIEINSLHLMPNGLVWIATTDGLYSWSFASRDLQQINNSEITLGWGNIVSDRNGNILVGNKALELYSSNGELLNNKNKELQKPGVSHVYCDKNGVIWIGTNGDGIYYSDPNLPSITLVKTDQKSGIELTSDYVSTIYSKDDESIYIGNQQGLNLYNKAQKQNKVITREPINYLYGDDKNLWAASKGTLIKINLENFRIERIYNFPYLDNTKYMGKNKKGLLMVGTENGLFEIDLISGESKKIFPTGNTLDESRITDVIEQPNGYLMATPKGLYQYIHNSKIAKKLTSSNQALSRLKNIDIKCLYTDRSGLVNIGTWGDGLFRWDPKKDLLTHYTRKDGLPDDVIYGVLEDRSGRLWMSTNFGLSRFDYRSESFFNLDINYGLQSNEFNTSAYYRSKRGTLYFGGVDGLNFFKPESIENTLEPDTYISKVSIQNENESIPGLTDSDKSVYLLDTIILAYDQNMLNLEFFGNNLTLANQNQYAYYMEGLESDWNYVGNRRFASYSSIPPGEYTFKVKSSNNNGLWDKSPKTLQVIINPPYWQTLWFRMMVIGLLSGLIYLGFRYRLRLIKGQKRKLESTVKSRTADLKNVIQIIKKNSKNLSHTGENLKNKSGILAGKAKSQAETTRLIESDVKKVTEQTRKTSQNAQATNELGKNALDQLEQIREATQKNVSMINEINEKVVILEEIFRQTNILSLNASIEAASAGEYGGGFAIIASEIRQLAQKSYMASKEIGNSALEGNNYTKQVGELILNFLPQIKKSAALVKEISDSTVDQNNYIENINQSLYEFFDTSRQNSNISNEIFTVSSELDKLARYLSDQVNKITI